MWYQLSLFPSSNAAIAMQHHPGHIHQSVPTPRYSATPWFFSSSLADVALRLGPYMSISCRKDVCTRTQLVHMSRQIDVKKPKNTQDHQTTTTRKSPSQTCVSPEETAKQPEKQPRHTKGAGARTKHPQNRFAKGHSGLTTASLSKTCEK